MTNMTYYFSILLLFYLIIKVNSNGMSVVFSWKQISYNFDGVLYTKNSDYDRTVTDNVHFADELEEAEKFFIQYNNVPIGFELYGDTVFVTVPRRRHGIPSTLNYVTLSDRYPILRPYPNVASRNTLVSVYRPRVDECGRLWMVDTGLLEVPEERKQIQPPSLVVYDLSRKTQIFRYQLKPTDLFDERTPAGLTSITVDVGHSCEDTYAYITDLATNGLIIFSLRERDSWRIQDDSFRLDERAMNFTVSGHVINWRDGLFSIALSHRDAGGRTAFFHPLVSTQEFSIGTAVLKSSKRGQLSGKATLLGTRGPLTQSGSHDYHEGILFFANVAQDGVLCWNTRKPLTPENVVLVAQDHEKLVYISDLKVKSDEVWVLANQIPRFVYGTLDPGKNNFYILKGKVQDLIQNTNCA